MNQSARLPAVDLLRRHGYDDEARLLERQVGKPARLTRHEAVVLREVAVRSLAEHYAGTPNAKADAIVRNAARYAARWSCLAELDAPPEHHRDRPEACLFQLHKLADAGARWPLGKSAIRAMLPKNPVEIGNFHPDTDDHRSEEV